MRCSVSDMATEDFKPGLLAVPPFRGSQLAPQGGIGHASDVGTGHQGSPLGGDAPDPPVLMVAVRMPEGGLIMPDDGIVPIGDIERPFRTETDFHRPETLVGRAEELHGFNAAETGAFGLEGKAVNVVGVIARDEELPAQPLRQMAGFRDLTTHALPRSAPDVGNRHKIELVRRRDQPRSDEPHFLVVAFDKHRPPPVKGHATGVLTGEGREAERFKPHRHGVEPPKARGVTADQSPGGFHVRLGVQSLTKGQRAIGPPGQVADVLMGVRRAKSGQDNLPAICLVITIGVAEPDQVFALSQVDAIGPQHESGGHVQSRGKHRGMISPAIAVAVLQDEEFVIRQLPRLELGIGQRAEHPEPSAMVPLQGHGVRDTIGLIGKERDLQTRMQGEGCQFRGHGVVHGLSLHRVGEDRRRK